MDERPLKRARVEESNEGNHSTTAYARSYGPAEISGSAIVHLGDNLVTQNHYYQQECASGVVQGNSDRFEVLHQSLLFPRMNARMLNVDKALHDTCTWLFQHRSFQAWHSGQNLREHNGFLWIKGKPGCGKSTLMRTALDWTQREVEAGSVNDTVVYYFFNARASSSLEKSTLGLYRSLVYQILRSFPSTQSLFTSKFALKVPQDPGDAWTETELKDFLSDLVTLHCPLSLCMFIDALDEGEHENDTRQMIGFLVDLSEQALASDSSLALRICLSSRHYPHISIKKGLSLVVEEQSEHNEDIEAYVQKKLFGSDSEYKEELRAEICRKSASVFLWVVLVVRMLNEIDDQGAHLSVMRSRLDEIPQDLNELFSDILTKSRHGAESSVSLLQWVLFSTRSLKPTELYLAVQYSQSPANFAWTPSDNIDVPSANQIQKYILDCSRGLVELTPTQPSIVQFIHETVRDYLIHSKGLASLFPALSSNLRGLSHDMLKTSCIRYITRHKNPGNLTRYSTTGHITKSVNERIEAKLDDKVPFIMYSVLSLFQHAEYAQSCGISQEYFLRSRVDRDGIWQGPELIWWNILERFKVRKISLVTLTYFLAAQGLSYLLEELLSFSNTANTESGRYGTPLHAACIIGNEETVRLLIANGADVNARNDSDEHPVAAAISSKNLHIASILQQQGARPKPAMLHKTLLASVARGSKQSVDLLLEFGAEANAEYANGMTVLEKAIHNKRFDIAEVLLRRNVIDQKFSEIRDSILLTATQYGHEPMVRLLIEKGAGNSLQGSFSARNILHSALEMRHGRIAYFLIQHWGDINAQCGAFGKLLVKASQYGHKEVVQLLIEKGADVNAQDRACSEALLTASAWGHEDIAQLLIEKGADVNSKVEHYGNALQTASAVGREKVVRSLIEKGADVHAFGGKYGTALQAASVEGHEQIVELLIEKGADVNAHGGEYGTALRAATEYGHKHIVKILLDAGAKHTPRLPVRS